MKNKVLRAKKVFSIILVLIIATLLCGCGEEKSGYPEATKEFFVNDFADIISQEEEKTIYAQGIALQEKTDAQAVVITIDSLDGKAAADYALEIGREWGVGDQEKNNGIVVLLSEEDREIYIAVGYGLEGALPDSKVGRIIDTYAIPHLSSDDYSTALASVYKSIVNEVYLEYDIEIEGDYTPMATLPETEPETEEADAASILLSWVVLVGLVALYIVIFGRRGIFLFTAPRHYGGFHGGFGGGSGGSFGGFSGGGGSFGGGGAGRKF